MGTSVKTLKPLDAVLIVNSLCPSRDTGNGIPPLVSDVENHYVVLNAASPVCQVFGWLVGWGLTAASAQRGYLAPL